MSRDGFAIADIDVGIAHDPKVIKLSRRGHNSERTAAHLGLYLCLVVESWGAGERMTLEDAAPAWWLDAVDGYADELHAVGLIDEQHRIPDHSWHAWFGPAHRRRDDRRLEGTISGLVSHGWAREEAAKEAARRRSEAGPEVTPRSPQGLLDPSVLPAGRPSDRQAGRGSSQPTPVEGVVSEIQTCDECHGPLLGEPWRLRKAKLGRVDTVHDRCADGK